MSSARGWTKGLRYVKRGDIPRWARRPRGCADVRVSWSRESGMHRRTPTTAVTAATTGHSQTA